MTETEKLAQIQSNFIVPAQENRLSCDIVIKIRDGVIVFSEVQEKELKRLVFSTQLTKNTFGSTL